MVGNVQFNQMFVIKSWRCFLSNIDCDCINGGRLFRVRPQRMNGLIVLWNMRKYPSYVCTYIIYTCTYKCANSWNICGFVYNSADRSELQNQTRLITAAHLWVVLLFMMCLCVSNSPVFKCSFCQFLFISILELNT